MDWTQLRSMMNKSRIVKHSGRSGRPRLGRKLANQTYAYLYEMSEPTELGDPLPPPERIEVELFEKEIICYHSDGNFKVNNHSYWASPTTKDRFRRFLPGGGYVSSWRFNEYSRPLQLRPAKARVWCLSLRGGGCHPWKNDATYSYNGHRKELILEVNETDANKLCHLIQTFAMESIKELNAGALGASEDCEECVVLDGEIERAFAGNGFLTTEQEHWMQRHALQHVLEQKPSMSLTYTATKNYGSDDASLAAYLMAKENQSVWKKKLVRTKEQRAQRIERLLTEPRLSELGLHPPRYNKYLRWLIERHLLVTFGFEIGHG